MYILKFWFGQFLIKLETNYILYNLFTVINTNYIIIYCNKTKTIFKLQILEFTKILWVILIKFTTIKSLLIQPLIIL